MNESKKGNKLILGIFWAVIILIVGGSVFLFVFIKSNNEKMIHDMEGPAKDYFNNYMSVNSGANAYKVTLAMLKKANEEEANYNLDSLAGCNEEKTYATVSVDFSNGEIKDVEITLNCKKF